MGDAYVTHEEQPEVDRGRMLRGKVPRGGKANARNSDDSFSLFLLPSQRDPTGVGQAAQQQIEAAIAAAHLPTLDH